MGTPLQQRAYELTLRVANIWVQGQGAGQALDVHRRLFDAAADIGAWTEKAAGAPSREAFRTALYEINTSTRLVKLWLRLLDDLGFIDPEAASPLNEVAEEVHRLVLAALRTCRDGVTNGQVVQV
jgi:four helix bundle protein